MPNTSSAENVVELTDDYLILAEGALVGHIEPIGENDQIIGHIEIEPEARGNGYSRTATKLFLERAKEREVNSVSCSVVISGAYEHVLRGLGFTEIAHEEDGLYLAKSL